ncbi:hypothetical protein AFLA_010028 [Aspergillus flavus NRRL3357]|nr:hypothetical protein AFLA_010028 [Aspergillus flavus NRRL3357]
MRRLSLNGPWRVRNRTQPPMEADSGSFSSTQTSARDRTPLSLAPNALRWSGIKIDGHATTAVKALGFKDYCRLQSLAPIDSGAWTKLWTSAPSNQLL